MRSWVPAAQALVVIGGVALGAWAGARMPHAGEPPPPPRASGAFATVGDLRMYYELRGPEGAPPLLVLHGGGDRLEGMDAQIAFFSKEFRVVAPEQIGQGRTNDAPRAYAYDDMADDTLALLDLLQVTAPVRCLGWSDGGIVCLSLAMRHARRVDRVAVSGVNYGPAGLNDGARRWLERAVGAEVVPRAPAVGDKLLQMWRTQPNWTEADLGRIQAPVLVMAGEHDAVGAPHTRALAGAIPRARLRIVAGASHRLPQEQPELFDREVEAFFHEARDP